MEEIGEIGSQILKAVRKENPLIHNITNYVVMNYTANALLAFGASPIMAHASEEVEEIVSMARALVLNIGTLTKEWINSMILAGEKASQLGIPIILDPVGSGATTFRTDSVKRIINKCKIDVIRGNASEILSLCHQGFNPKGVDTIHSVEDAMAPAKGLAKELQTTICITGPVDLVTDGDRVVRVSNGHEMMSLVTGTGCTATAIIGAFLAMGKDPVNSAAGGLAFWGLSGEMAAKKTSAPGSFMISMLDALYEITPSDLKSKSKILQI